MRLPGPGSPIDIRMARRYKPNNFTGDFSMTMARRSFLKQAGVAVAVVAGGRAALTGVAHAVGPVPTGSGQDPFRLGVAGYTFNKFKLEPTLEMLKKVDVHFLCIKDFHLPLNSTDDQIATFHAQCRSYGVTGYGVGPIYMGSPDEVSQAFAYAKRVGVKTVVGVPFKMVDKKRVASPELLDLIHEKVQEYDICYAIHNHGPDMPELFPSAESAMELIHAKDKRVGLCLDIGHELRDGKDPVKAMTDFAGRIHDIHLKNVTSADKKGRGIELPRGAIDIPAFAAVFGGVTHLRGVEPRPGLTAEALLKNAPEQEKSQFKIPPVFE